MKRTPLFAFLFTIVLCSCHKNKGGDDDGNTDNQEPTPTDTAQASKNLLSQTVLTYGGNTATKVYQYDAQNRLIWTSSTSTEASYYDDTSKIIRDGSGTIQRIIYRSDTSKRYSDPKLDSIVFNVFSAGGKYTDKVAKYSLFSNKFHFRDSSHYTYNGDRITKEEAYYWDSSKTNLTPTYKQWATREFTYDAAGNMTKLDVVFIKVDSTTDYPGTFTYTYSTKGVNLLNLGNEAVVIGLYGTFQNFFENFSPFTPLTFAATFPLNPEYNLSYKYYYTYNTAYRPLKADIIDQANNAKSTIVYTYQ